jgi:hypothetical protein
VGVDCDIAFVSIAALGNDPTARLRARSPVFTIIVHATGRPAMRAALVGRNRDFANCATMSANARQSSGALFLCR